MATERNHALEEELERVKDDLVVQRTRLQDIHTRHAEELEEVRKAGHDALAVVVEQYKVYSCFLSDSLKSSTLEGVGGKNLHIFVSCCHIIVFERVNMQYNLIGL